MRREFTLNRLKDLLWILTLAGVVVGLGRVLNGLGATTRIGDAIPWGAWNIFNVVAGVSASSGGFVLACVIYIFQIEKYRPLARAGVIIAFLGYSASLLALLFDFGLPWRFWHPFLMWNPDSFLFEVFWFVTLYWIMAAVEVLPIVFEGIPWPRFTRLLHELILPVIVVGITLSTLNHSSLGALFLVSPTRLHPLWYSTWMPVEFFLSAMGGGVAVVILVSLAYAWLYGKSGNMSLLGGLGKVVAFILALYLVLRATDFTVHRKWSYVLGGDWGWESVVFLVEILLQALLPSALLAVPGLRNRPGWLGLACFCAAAGLAMHRVDTAIVGYFRSAEALYYPSPAEVVLSLGVVSAAGLFFFFLVEHFYVFEPPLGAPAAGSPSETASLWTWKELRNMVFSFAAFRIIVIMLVTLPAAFLVFRNSAFRPLAPEMEMVLPPTGLDRARTLLRIDSNRRDESVDFPHLAHQELLGGGNSCLQCHHLSLPNDYSTACWRCHRDLFQPVSILRLRRHHILLLNTLNQQARWENHDQRKTTRVQACDPCHRHRSGEYIFLARLGFLPADEDVKKIKKSELDKTCYSCHQKDMQGMADFKDKPFNSMAVGYQEAMHGRCLACHRESAEKMKEQRPGLGECQACHPLSAPPAVAK